MPRDHGSRATTGPEASNERRAAAPPLPISNKLELPTQPYCEGDLDTLIDSELYIRNAVIMRLLRDHALQSPEKTEVILDSVHTAGERLARGEAEQQLVEPIRNVARHLRIPRHSVLRILGFGYVQTDCIAALVGIAETSEERTMVSSLGALFNLFICLFDAACDRSLGDRHLLLAQFDLARLKQMMTGLDHENEGTTDWVRDLFVIANEMFSRVRAREKATPHHSNISSKMVDMYHAQVLVTKHQHGRDVRTLSACKAMRQKSVMPIEMMGALALLARPEANTPNLRAQLRRAGNAMWIVDDLVDLRDDWFASAPNRSWWKLENTKDTYEKAARALAASSIPSREARHLSRQLYFLQRDRSPEGLRFSQCINATVTSWLAPWLASLATQQTRKASS
jgi:hypothetical protein